MQSSDHRASTYRCCGAGGYDLARSEETTVGRRSLADIREVDPLTPEFGDCPLLSKGTLIMPRLPILVYKLNAISVGQAINTNGSCADHTNGSAPQVLSHNSAASLTESDEVDQLDPSPVASPNRNSTAATATPADPVLPVLPTVVAPQHLNHSTSRRAFDPVREAILRKFIICHSHRIFLTCVITRRTPPRVCPTRSVWLLCTIKYSSSTPVERPRKLSCTRTLDIVTAGRLEFELRL